MANSNWKKNNFDMKIKVSEATVAQLRKGTMAGNIAKANKRGATPEYREAVRRFYGKGVAKYLKPIPGPNRTGGIEKPKAPPVKKQGPISRGNPKPTQADMDRARRAKAAANAKAIGASRTNPKPTAKDIAGGKKATARAAAKAYAPLTESRKNPKPSSAQLNAVAKKKYAANNKPLTSRDIASTKSKGNAAYTARTNKANAAAISSSRLNPKPSAAVLNAAAKKKAAAARTAFNKGTAKGTARKPTKGIYARTPGGM